MSGYEATSLSLSAIAVLVALIAVVIYQRQVREMRRENTHLNEALRVATTDALETGFAQVTATFIEQPLLRAVFYEDEAPDVPRSALGPQDFLRANALAERLLSLFSSALRLSAEGDGAHLPWFANYLKGSFSNSAHLRWYAIERRHWVDPLLVRLAEQADGATNALGEV